MASRGFLDLRSRTPAKDCMDGEKKRFWMEKSPSTDGSNWINLVAMDGEKKRLLLDGEIAEER